MIPDFIGTFGLCLGLPTGYTKLGDIGAPYLVIDKYTGGGGGGGHPIPGGGGGGGGHPIPGGRGGGGGGGGGGRHPIPGGGGLVD